MVNRLSQHEIYSIFLERFGNVVNRFRATRILSAEFIS